MITVVKTNDETTPALTPLLVPSCEAAKLLSICRKTLWTLTKNGRIPVVWIGTKKMYSVEELKKFVANSCELIPQHSEEP